MYYLYNKEGPNSECLFDTICNACSSHSANELKPKLSKYDIFIMVRYNMSVPLVNGYYGPRVFLHSTDEYMATLCRSSRSGLLVSIVWGKNMLPVTYTDWDLLHLNLPLFCILLQQIMPPYKNCLYRNINKKCTRLVHKKGTWPVESCLISTDFAPRLL